MISPSQIITAEQLIEKLAKNQLRNSEWIVKDELIIRNTTEFDKLHFKNITFKKAVKIGFSTIQFGVFFENCEFVEPVSIEQLVCDAYSHNENIDNCNVLFSSCKASYIHISNQSKFLRDIKFNNDCNIESLLITDTKVDRSGSIYVENSAITNIIDLSKVDSTFKI